MEYGYHEQVFSPPRGRTLEELRAFLARMDLSYAPDVEHTVIVRDSEEQIAATGSLEGPVIKCVAVDPAYQGDGLTASVLTALRRLALEAGQRRLFLYTKPANRSRFAGLGFWAVAATDQALMMEDRRGGFDAWAESLRSPLASGTVGAVVMNCNPMTLGHRYLVEQAAAQCDFLYLLVVSEDRSAVPAEDRRAIVEAAAADLDRVSVTGTGQYLISEATFPDYFIKDKHRTGAVWADMDIAVFLLLAQRLGISRRFVGSEPLCPVTAAYNRAMAQALPAHGVQLVELERLELAGAPVSATAVRQLVQAGCWQEIRPLVPEATLSWFARAENRERFLARL